MVAESLNKQANLIQALDDLGLGNDVFACPGHLPELPSKDCCIHKQQQFTHVINGLERADAEGLDKSVSQTLVLTAINLGFSRDCAVLRWKLPQRQSVQPSPTPPDFEVVLEKRGASTDFLVTVHSLRSASQSLEEGMAGYEVIGRCGSRSDVAKLNEKIMAVVGKAPYCMKHEASGQQLVYRMTSTGVPSFLGCYLSPIERRRLQEFDLSWLIDVTGCVLKERDLLGQYAIKRLLDVEMAWLKLSEIEIKHSCLEGLLVIANLRSESEQHREAICRFYEKLGSLLEDESFSKTPEDTLIL